MAALSAVGGGASVGFHQQGPSEREIEEAIEEFIGFLDSPDAMELIGNWGEFGQVLKMIYQENGNDRNRAFANGMGGIFTDIFGDAEEKGFLTGSSRIFFDDHLDQVAFVDVLAKKIIASVEEEAELVGEVVPAAEEAVEEAFEDLLAFIRSNLFGSIAKCDLENFRQKLMAIAARPFVDELDPFLVNTKEGPGYSKLFADLIQHAEMAGFIEPKTREIYFEAGFNQIAFIQRIIKEIE